LNIIHKSIMTYQTSLWARIRADFDVIIKENAEPVQQEEVTTTTTTTWGSRHHVQTQLPTKIGRKYVQRYIKIGGRVSYPPQNRKKIVTRYIRPYSGPGLKSGGAMAYNERKYRRRRPRYYGKTAYIQPYRVRYTPRPVLTGRRYIGPQKVYVQRRPTIRYVTKTARTARRSTCQ